MSEYDAGSLPPICPDCGESECVVWVECGGCVDDDRSCGVCGGDGGWYECENCPPDLDC